MKFLLDLGWAFAGLLKYASLALALSGVAVFGMHFIRTTGRSAKADEHHIPAEAWRGPGARLAAKFFAAGVALQLFAILLSAVLPQRS